MEQKELTKTFVMISNLKNPFGLYTNSSACESGHARCAVNTTVAQIAIFPNLNDHKHYWSSTRENGTLC